MAKDFFKHYIYPIATLSGSIIGVGFLSLPYITTKVGIVTMLFYLVVLTALVTVIHVIYGKVCLATPDFKRWPGFAGFYFGNWAKRLILVPIILGGFGVLLAYLIVGSEFLHAIFSPLVGGDPVVYAFLYLAVLSLVVYFGVKAISRLEFWAIILLISSLLLILLKGIPHFNLANFHTGLRPNVANFFLPYGAILFSVWGTALIPEVEEMIRGHKKSLRSIIVIGTLIPTVVYLAFILLVVGISGNQTTESALVGLKNILGNGIASLVLFVGVITTFTAFIAEGLFLKKVFMYDLKISEKLSWALVCLTPLVLFLLGFHSFIPLISFVGAVLLGFDGILILLIYQKIGGKKVVAYPLMTVFVLGVVYALLFTTF